GPDGRPAGGCATAFHCRIRDFPRHPNRLLSAVYAALSRAQLVLFLRRVHPCRRSHSLSESGLPPTRFRYARHAVRDAFGGSLGLILSAAIVVRPGPFFSGYHRLYLPSSGLVLYAPALLHHLFLRGLAGPALSGCQASTQPCGGVCCLSR